ncbi:hypothetical protein K2173_006752 [Erythroxylum novogranatense]|uniref:GPI-anchored protein LLG1-like domain-containing protein n=1 Tax=Erythroxylum novogranatense TaxID=1862640 RepID=A0AAV8T666_9ROSI|nr:hypothetical protein K2173_006752 [Erythroxylum novogranatense]
MPKKVREMSCFLVLCFFLLIGIATSSSLISYDLFEGHGQPGGRSLLQMTKNCNVSFENADYSVLTSKCKGPTYPPEQCCGAFKEFACPYRDALNDVESDCATAMFSYINLYGKYPPGLFANLCKEGKEGLDCDANKDKNGASHISPFTPFMLLASTLVLLVIVT